MGGWPSKAAPAASSTPGWPDLPPELADLVLRRLPSLVDRLRFAFVCRRWLHAATRYSPPGSRPRLPWLSFLDGNFRSLPDGELHHIAGFEDAACLGSFGSWLLFEKVGRRRRSRRRLRRHLLLHNPLRHRLAGATVRLPGRCKAPIPAIVNADGSHDGACSSSSATSSTAFFISKVIVCSSDLVAAKVNYRDGTDVVVCCRPGMSLSWSTGLFNGHYYSDMALHNEKLYTVTRLGDLFAHEVAVDAATGEPRVHRIQHVIQAPHTLDGDFATTAICVKTSYLVVSQTGKLLMVRWIIPFSDRYNSERSAKHMTFKVFEADLEMSRWLEVDRLEDQVLFVSMDCSKAISACNYQQGKNKIYFLDQGHTSLLFGTTSNLRTCVVYDMSSKTIQSISLGEVRISDQARGSWFFP
ncbi:hypothetical protein ACP4OV_002421 [Aristida adscensionis]